MKRVITSLLANKNSMSGSIPSPFWQPGERPVPPEVQEEINIITKEMQPGIDRLCRLVKEQDLNCFDISGGMHGIQVFLAVHNPNKPHPDFPSDEEVAEMLRRSGIPIPPGATVRATTHKIVPPTQSTAKAPNAAPVPPQPATEDVKSVPADLVAGIEQVLRQFYSTVKDINVLGTSISPHHSAAMEIAKIMETARVRDRNEMLLRLTEFINGFKS